MSCRPRTPDEVHTRVYRQSLERLAGDARAPTEQLCGELLDELLTPVDLTVHPTTFGPIDDDPLYPILHAAKRLDPTKILPSDNAIQTEAGKQVLRAAYKGLKRNEAMTVTKRLDDISARPNPVPLSFATPILSAKAIREGRAVMVDLRPPSSLRQLFLPSSKHFCTSKIKVENLEVPKVSEEDALGLKWHLEPAQMKQVQDDIIKAMPQSKSLDAIWAGWKSQGVGGLPQLQLYSPIFPIVEARNERQWYNEVFELLAEVPLANTAGEDEGLREGGLYDDMDAYDIGVLDEFDPPRIHTRAMSQSESSRHSHSTEGFDTSSTETKKPWQMQPNLVFLTALFHEPTPEPEMPPSFGPTDMDAELEPIDGGSASSRDTAGYIATIFSQDHLPMWNDLDSTLSQSLSQSQPLLQSAEEMERYIDYDKYAQDPVQEQGQLQELPTPGPALEPSQDEESISKAFVNYQDTLGRHHAAVASRVPATNRVYHAARSMAVATVATPSTPSPISSTPSPTSPRNTTPTISHRPPSATGSDWYETSLEPRSPSPNTNMATMATTHSPGRGSESLHAASVASEQLMIDRGLSLDHNREQQQRRSPYEPSTYTGTSSQQSLVQSQVDADLEGVGWHASWVRDPNATPMSRPQAAKSNPVWVTEPTPPSGPFWRTD